MVSGLVHVPVLGLVLVLVKVLVGEGIYRSSWCFLHGPWFVFLGPWFDVAGP